MYIARKPEQQTTGYNYTVTMLSRYALVDVNSLALGIETASGVFTKSIPK